MLDDNGNEVIEQEETPIEEENIIEDRGDNILDDQQEEEETDAAPEAEVAKEEEKETRIPKSRFDEVNNERKQLKAELEALRSQQAQVQPQEQAVPPVVFDLDLAEQQYAEATFEGEFEKAKAIRKQIREAEYQQMQADFESRLKQEKTADVVEKNTAVIVSNAYADFPQLNPESESYDAGLVNKINLMQSAYISQGQRYDVALQQAIADFVGDKPQEVKTVEKTVTDSKKRNLDAANRQPTSLANVGVGDRAAANSIKVENMTDTEFAALPEREKRRLRGD
jgi:hypothetical protein